MKTTTFALLSVVGSAAAQGVTGKISPQGPAPDGCSPNFDGKFLVSAIAPKAAGKRDLALEKRASCDDSSLLVVTLKDGQLVDAKSRTGYIASNFQFQFDGPPQAGAIFTAGFSACKNNTLAFGSTNTFYQCTSGTFSNLYDRSWAAQCSPVQLSIASCAAAAAGGVGQIGDGQVIATTVLTTTVIKPISDGQPQVVTTVVPIPLCQISDGQLQVHTTPCASITSVPRPTSTFVPISQYSDGQIQVTRPSGGAPPPATQGSSGTVRTSGPAPTAPPATGTTLRSSASSGSAPATQTRSSTASTPTSSGTTVSGAGAVEMGSLAALAVGILGAVWVL